MKTRRHHNNKGLRQIRRGKTREQVARMAARLGIPLSGSANSGAVAGRLIAARSTSTAGEANPERLSVSNNRPSTTPRR